MPDLQPSTVPVGTLAQIINIGVVRIQQLAKLGVVVKSARGQYDLFPSITGYVRYLQEGNSGTSSASGSEEDGEVSSDDYHKHRARLYKAKADAAELEAMLLRGRLHDADAVRKVMEDMISASRAKMLGVSRKVSGKVKGLTELVEIEATIDEAIHQALNELTHYDPSRFTQQTIQDHQPTVEAPAEADGEPMG